MNRRFASMINFRHQRPFDQSFISLSSFHVTSTLLQSNKVNHRCSDCSKIRFLSSFNENYRSSNSLTPAFSGERLRRKYEISYIGISKQPVRFLWGWLNSVFNRVDESRIKEVGPDRACAEWLLRCGAGVKWDKGSDEWLRDYNSLPAGNYRTLKIVEIDATDSAVMHIGFPHFKGLTHLRKAVFHKCGYMEDEAVRQMGYLKDTLEDLQISSCGNVTDDGILTLVQMKNLKKLKLYDFMEVRNRKKCLSVLQDALPNCDIHFPFAREEDKDPPSEKNVEKA